MSAASVAWFAAAPALVDARNRRETGAFRELVESHQQLLLRAAPPLSLSASAQLSASSSALDQADAQADKYLAAIQHLEAELADKTARLAAVAGNQLQLVQESKELLRQREKWDATVQLLTKQLEEEKAIGAEKDRALRELDAALAVQRGELGRQRALLETSEAEGERLRRQVAALEQQVADKNALLQQWLDQDPDDDDRRAATTATAAALATQETAERLSRAALGDDAAETADASRLVARPAFSIRAHATEANSVCFNASGKTLFSGSSDGTVRAWGADSGRALGEYRGVGTAQPLLCVRVAEDGELVLGTGCDRKSFVWRVATGRVFQTLAGHKGKVLAAAFSLAAPHEVVTGSSDRSLRVWDVASGRRLLAVNCHSGCNDLAAAAGGQLASAHQDGAVRFWDPRAKTLVRELRGLHEDQVTSVSFARGGELLLTSSRDDSLCLVDPRTFAVVRTLRDPAFRCGFDWSRAALSPDGRFAAAGSASGAVLVWDAATGRLARSLRGGHQGAVACCMWRPDGGSLASCDKNGCVVLWE